jgi:hypothetical protein
VASFLLKNNFPLDPPRLLNFFFLLGEKPLYLILLLNRIMNRPLSEFDKVYKSLENTLSKDEKARYCRGVIDRTKDFLTKNRSKLTPQIQRDTMDFIQAAKNELDSHLGDKNKTF